MKMVSEMVKCHPGFWGGIFGNFKKRIERLQNSNDYIFIPYLISLIIFFNKKH